MVAVIAAFVLAWAVAYQPQAHSQTPTVEFGIASVGILQDQSASEARTEMDAVDRTGSTWVRVVINWNETEPRKGTFDWKYADNAISAARAEGLQVLALLTGPAPRWAQSLLANPFDNGTPPADASTFGNFAKAAANRYKSAVSNWEIWNEPNHPHYFNPPDPKRYTAILKAAYTQIRSVQSSANIISGGLAPIVSEGIQPTTFLQAMYTNGAKAFFTNVGLHPYTFPYSISDDPNGRAAVMGQIRDIMVARGDSAKRIWNTEYGAPTGSSSISVSEEYQAQILKEMVNYAAATSYLGPVFLFTVRDLAANSPDPEYNFGVYWNDYTPKAAVATLRGLATST